MCLFKKWINTILKFSFLILHVLICLNLQIVALCPVPSFGLIFGDFLDSLGEKTSALTLLNSAFFSSLAFSGTIISVNDNYRNSLYILYTQLIPSIFRTFNQFFIPKIHMPPGGHYWRVTILFGKCPDSFCHISCTNAVYI